MYKGIDIPEEFTELVEPTRDWRYYCFYGGRSSGKSTTVATFLLIRGMEKKTRVLCVRETQNSIAESVHQLMADIIDKYGLKSWEITREEIRNKDTGSTIIFKGVHNNTQAIKSLEGIDICWCEEAQSISSASLDILIPTIRKDGSFLIFTWNPLTENDPVWERVAGKPDDRTLVKKVNSDAIERLLSKEIIHEREKMLADNPDMYAHVWLGEPLASNTGSVFGKQLSQATADGRVGSVPYDGSVGVYTAWDLGVGDCTTIWFFQVVGREIRFIDHYEASGEDLGHYLGIVNNKPYRYQTHYLPHDARHRELQSGITRVEFFEQNGFHNVEVLRPTNFSFGTDDINMVARPMFSRCYFDQDKCKRGLECLRAYHYEFDAKNNLLKSKPEHDWSSHSASSFVYALMAVNEDISTRQNTKVKTFTPKSFRPKESRW